MSINQLNIQRNDWIFQQLEVLKIERTLIVGELRISRTERFYVVGKKAEFEEVFRNIEGCYEFTNGNLLH